MQSFKSYLSETALNAKDPHGDYQAKSKALQDLSMNKDVDQDEVQQRKLDLDKEYSKVKKEEVDQIDELNLSTLQSYQAKRGNRDARMKTAVAAMDHIFSKKKGEPPHQIHGRGLQRARAKVDAIRKKQTEMNPQKPVQHPAPKTGFRSGAMDDTYGT